MTTRPNNATATCAALTTLKESVPYGTLRALRAKAGRSRFGERELAHLGDWLHSNDAAIDIGANLGFYSYRMSALARHVVAIEPNPRLARHLRRSAKLAGIRNLTVLEAACGATSGTGKFTIPTDHGISDHGQAHLSSDDENFDLIVELVSLDQYLAVSPQGHIGVIKIDVEGSELAVIVGARATIIEHRPVLICEVQEEWCRRYGHRAADVFSQLSRWGYHPHQFVDGAMQLQAAHGPQSGTANVNYVFLP